MDSVFFRKFIILFHSMSLKSYDDLSIHMFVIDDFYAVYRAAKGVSPS